MLEKLIKVSDVMVENFGPGALDRMGFTWKRIQELNPKMILASVKGFSDGHHYEDLKVYENVAQCAGGAASTTGFWDGPPDRQRRGAGRQQHRHAPGHRHPDGPHRPAQTRPARARRSPCSMQDAVLNLCRVKLRDQQRLDRLGYLEEYPQYPHGKLHRRGAARRQRRRRRPAGLGAQVQGLGDRPQRLHLLHDPGPCLGADLRRASASPSGRTTRPTRRRRRASRTSPTSSRRSRTG